MFIKNLLTQKIRKENDLLQIIYALSHANASVERRFSVNQETLIVHFNEDSFVASQDIIDVKGRMTFFISKAFLWTVLIKNKTIDL